MVQESPTQCSFRYYLSYCKLEWLRHLRAISNSTTYTRNSITQQVTKGGLTVLWIFYEIHPLNCALTAGFLAGQSDLFLFFTRCHSQITLVIINISIWTTNWCKESWTAFGTDTFSDANWLDTLSIMLTLLDTTWVSYKIKTSKQCRILNLFFVDRWVCNLLKGWRIIMATPFKKRAL